MTMTRPTWHSAISGIPVVHMGLCAVLAADVSEGDADDSNSDVGDVVSAVEIEMSLSTIPKNMICLAKWEVFPRQESIP